MGMHGPCQVVSGRGSCQSLGSSTVCHAKSEGALGRKVSQNWLARTKMAFGVGTPLPSWLEIYPR
jgi:hypothetical protein